MIKSLKKFNFWDGKVKGTGQRRTSYLDKLEKLNQGNTIVAVTGLRRTGKSFIIRQFIDFLIREKSIKPQQIFYANLFIRELDQLKNPDNFLAAMKTWQTTQNVDTTTRMYIFIDEIQEIFEWQKLICSLYEDYTNDYKIFITGSNAKLLGGELGTYLAGRSHNLTIFPLSFKEYLLFTNSNKTTATFSEYLQNGGMPEIVLADNEFAKNNLIETTVDSVIMRDIATRYEIRNLRLLRKIVDFLCSSAADEISRNKLTNILQQGNGKASIHTVSDYIEYLKEAFFIHECPVFSHKKNDLLKSVPHKIYLNDHIFTQHKQNYGGFGKLLENLIYIELKRRGYSVSTVKISLGEIDFLAEKNTERCYYQVTWTTSDKDSKVYQREFGNLMKIKDHFPKYVISMDNFIHPPDQGIKHIHAIDFLTNENLA